MALPTPQVENAGIDKCTTGDKKFNTPVLKPVGFSLKIVNKRGS